MRSIVYELQNNFCRIIFSFLWTLITFTPPVFMESWSDMHHPEQTFKIILNTKVTNLLLEYRDDRISKDPYSDSLSLQRVEKVTCHQVFLSGLPYPPNYSAIYPIIKTLTGTHWCKTTGLDSFFNCLNNNTFVMMSILAASVTATKRSSFVHVWSVINVPGVTPWKVGFSSNIFCTFHNESALRRSRQLPSIKVGYTIIMFDIIEPTRRVRNNPTQ